MQARCTIARVCAKYFCTRKGAVTVIKQEFHRMMLDEEKSIRYPEPRENMTFGVTMSK